MTSDNQGQEAQPSTPQAPGANTPGNNEATAALDTEAERGETTESVAAPGTDATTSSPASGPAAAASPEQVATEQPAAGAESAPAPPPPTDSPTPPAEGVAPAAPTEGTATLANATSSEAPASAKAVAPTAVSPADAVAESSPRANDASGAPAASAETPAANAASVRPSRRVVDVSAERNKPSPKPAKRPAPTTSREPEVTTADFAAMLDASGAAAPGGPVREGERVTGTVVYVGEDNAFIDLGGKTEGFIARGELVGEDGELAVGPGDKVEAYVVSTTSAGIHLSKALSRTKQVADSLRNALASGVPVEGKVSGVNKGGFDIQIFGHRAFCPMSHIDIAYTDKPEEHVGQTYRFRVTKVESKGKNLDVVVSRTALLREERAEKAGEIMKDLQVGQLRTGRIRNLQPFGAFVDLGGVDGLIHISALSWGRVDHPSEVVKVGDEVQVKVINLEKMELGPDKARISLSLKEAQASPWDRVGTDFVEGGIYDGEVVRLEQYGAFIQLAQGLDGLAHVSELAHGRVHHPRDVLKRGQAVRCKILSIDKGRRRIGLSLKALAAEPWDTVADRYQDGQTVEGVVDGIENFGVFLRLEPGVTGLIPLSELNTRPGSDPSRDFKVGQTLEAAVVGIDLERRRMTLSRRPEGERGKPRERSDGAQRDRRGGRDDRRGRGRSGGGRREHIESSEGSMGTLGDLFRKKLDKS